MQFKPGEYVIMLKGNVVARGELMMNQLLAINPSPSAPPLDGELTKEPTFGLPAYWIKESAKEAAMGQGYTVVDTPTVLTTHLTEVVKRHAHEYLGRQEVQQMLDNIKSSHPKVVEELVPNLISLGGVGKVLQNLLQEQVPVRDLLSILETMADWASFTKDVDVLTEYVRQGLARTITNLYQADDGTLPVITLEQSAEEMISSAVQQTDQGSFLALAPDQAQQLMRALSTQLEKVTSMGLQPVVLCAGPIRTHFKKLADRFIPNLVVLSYNEILNQIKVQSIGTVGMSDAN
jgi:flagellar biosynthesis protein FlhA